MRRAAVPARASFGRRLVASLRRIDPRVLDAALALALTAIALLSLLARSGSNPGPFEKDDLVGILLVMAQTFPLAFRRRAPLIVLVVISAAVVAHSALGYAQVQAGTFSSLIALYTVASQTLYAVAFCGVIISTCAVAAFFLTNRGSWDWEVIVSTTATWGLAWGAGIFARLRAEQVEVAGARVVRLELEQEVRAREAVADERARMARELHDIIGHTLNLIVIQTGGARRVSDTRPEVARESLASIESAGREALSDLERMLGVMRAAENTSSTAGPQPSLADLPALADHVSDAGLRVEVTFEGEAQDIPTSLGLTAYRIVQESLTNCLKHSGASEAAVTVRYQPTAIEIEVVDNGRGTSKPPARSGGGRGYLGMRERVAVFGGELSLGPGPGPGGYVVRARLPYVSAP